MKIFSIYLMSILLSLPAFAGQKCIEMDCVCGSKKAGPGCYGPGKCCPADQNPHQPNELIPSEKLLQDIARKLERRNVLYGKIPPDDTEAKIQQLLDKYRKKGFPGKKFLPKKLSADGKPGMPVTMDGKDGVKGGLGVKSKGGTKEYDWGNFFNEPLLGEDNDKKLINKKLDKILNVLNNINDKQTEDEVEFFKKCKFADRGIRCNGVLYVPFEDANSAVQTKPSEHMLGETETQKDAKPNLGDPDTKKNNEGLRH